MDNEDVTRKGRCSDNGCDTVDFKNLLESMVRFTEHARTVHGMEGSPMTNLAQGMFAMFTTQPEQMSRILATMKATLINMGFTGRDLEITFPVVIETGVGAVVIGSTIDEDGSKKGREDIDIEIDELMRSMGLVSEDSIPNKEDALFRNSGRASGRAN